MIEEQLSAVDNKLERLEEHYVLEEITQEIFQKYKAKFLEERAKIDEQKLKIGIRVLNRKSKLGFRLHGTRTNGFRGK